MSAERAFDEDCAHSQDFDPLAEALRAWEIRRSEPKDSHRLALYLIDHALEFDDPMVTGWAYLTCGAHELAANKLADAEQSLGSAKKLFHRIGERRGESLSVILHARVYMSRGEFHPALEMYKSIIEREAHGLETLEKFEAFNSISGCFWGLDKVELCLLYLSKAFDTLRNTSYDSERATVLSNMAVALTTVGNYGAAKEFFTAASEFSQHSNNRGLGLNILTGLVSCLIELKDVGNAVRISARMLTEYKDLAFSGPSNTALCNAAIAFAKGKRWALADQCLIGAQAIAKEAGLTTSRTFVAQAEATIAETRGEYAVAAARCEWILTEFANDLSKEARAQIYSLLIECYQRTSRLADVLEVKKKKLALLENSYQAGLAAAMVILDLRTSLNRLPAL